MEKELGRTGSKVQSKITSKLKDQRKALKEDMKRLKKKIKELKGSTLNLPQGDAMTMSKTEVRRAIFDGATMGQGCEPPEICGAPPADMDGDPSNDGDQKPLR